MGSGRTLVMSCSKFVKISERYEASPIDDELLLIDVDTGKCFALKDVGLRIWNLLDTEGDLDGISRILCDEYEVEPQQARESVNDFARSLINAGFARFE